MAWLAWQSFAKGQTIIGIVFCVSIVGFAIGIPHAVRFDRNRRITKPGHCRTCGYDLRASKGKCPECGAAIA